MHASWTDAYLEDLHILTTIFKFLVPEPGPGIQSGGGAVRSWVLAARLPTCETHVKVVLNKCENDVAPRFEMSLISI